MFKVLADAEVSAVPAVKKTSVSADNDGEAVISGSSSVGTGYSEYVVAVVRTIRKESRGFESERHVVNRRRSEEAGREEESAESWADASSGSGVSEVEDDSTAAASFNRFLLRCGGSEPLSRTLAPRVFSAMVEAD